MARIDMIDGVKYVERNYKCFDCDWSWTQVTTKDAPLQTCPNCQTNNKQRLSKISDMDTVIDKVKRGPNRPKSKNLKPVEYGKGKKGFPSMTSQHQANMKKAAALAFEEAKKQGASDMIDSGLRIGDIGAPPINNSVTDANKEMFGRDNGWAGNNAASYMTGANHPQNTDGMRVLQTGLQHGMSNDMLTKMVDNKFNQ